MTEQSDEPLLLVTGLKKYFPVYGGLLRRRSGSVKAVDGVSFAIARGKTLGLVGESGSGKSTTGRTILQLEHATGGSVRFTGIELTQQAGNALRRLRPRMQMVFQDPQASLNPRMTVGSIVGEPLREHVAISKEKRRTRVAELLDIVGLDASFANRYPHEFSGGQRQRVGIARAIALNPELIVCDEPIAALDVSIQAQIVILLKELQKDFGLTYLMISHDIAMIRQITDQVAVMYLGKLMELADTEVLHEDPRHPYTRALLSAVPVPDPLIEANRRPIILKGDIPSPSRPPSGCPFRTRCPEAQARCSELAPEWRELGRGHWVACHFA
jgi:oligopeptide transport system ATP-binding protein